MSLDELRVGDRLAVADRFVGTPLPGALSRELRLHAVGS
jgi:hypothetical protein